MLAKINQRKKQNPGIHNNKQTNKIYKEKDKIQSPFDDSQKEIN